MKKVSTDQRESASEAAVDSVSRPIFLCYRQVDGKRQARWVFSALREALEQIGELADIYFDQTAPAITDWQALHGPALERARALHPESPRLSEIEDLFGGEDQGGEELSDGDDLVDGDDPPPSELYR